MTLNDLVRSIEALDPDDTICTTRPWTGDAPAVAVALASGPVPDELKRAGFAYFLEVVVALEVLEVLAKRPTLATLDEKLKLLLHYAEHDAHPAWVYE